MLCVLVTGDAELGERAQAYAKDRKMMLLVACDGLHLSRLLETILPDVVIVDGRESTFTEIRSCVAPYGQRCHIERVVGPETALMALGRARRRTLARGTGPT